MAEHRKYSWVAVAFLVLASSGHAADLPNPVQCRQLWEQQLNVKPEIQGWCLFIDPGKGNCLACHHLEGPYTSTSLEYSGNVGPVIRDVQVRYPDRRELQALIHDPSTINPDTVMPLYGRHMILDEREIGQIVKFLMLF